MSPHRSLAVLLLVACVMAADPLHAQAATGVAVVGVRASGAPLAGAIVRSGAVGTRTDATGVARLELEPGRARIQVRMIGFRPETAYVVIEAGLSRELSVVLRSHRELASAAASMADMPGMEKAADMASMEAVTVTSTRSERRIEDEPLRVEVMSGEMLAEQTQMRPKDITMTIAEMGGVRMQQTSGSLGGTRLRINGLRGQYSGLVFDGLPLFGATTDGFTYLQVAPLDLQQVEVIKGASTALYGPSALGGVLNLVSRRPDDVNELLVNGTTRGGADVSFWKGVNLGDGWGWSVSGEAHRQPPVDEDGDGWANFPAAARATVRPRLYHEAAGGATVLATVGATLEDRGGGVLPVIPGGYVETLHTTRLDAGITWRQPLNDSTQLTLKASAAQTSNDHGRDGVADRQRRLTAYAEATWSAQRGTTEWLVGAAWQHDALRARDAAALDFTYDAPALIAQHTWTPVRWLATQTSARCDLHSVYGTSCSPRLSVLWRPVRGWSARLSAGAATFAPTPLTDESDMIGLGRIEAAPVLAERARTVSLDLGGQPFGVEFNVTLALSRIENPVLGMPVVVGGVTKLRYVNAPGAAETRAVELLAARAWGDWRATALYGYLDGASADPADGLTKAATLIPKHAIGLGFGYEPKRGARVTVDAFYTGEQVLLDDPYRTRSVPYTLLCLLWVQPIRPGLEFWMNGENLLNIRQTQFDPLLLAAPDALGRRTTQVWGPLEGRVVNVGVRIRW